MTTATAGRAVGWTADASSFGARLALIRQRMGWGNVKEAALACGLPTETWRSWERDGREPHRLTTVAKQISSVTGCSYEWLALGPDRGQGGDTTEYRNPSIRPDGSGTLIRRQPSSRNIRRTADSRPPRPSRGQEAGRGQQRPRVLARSAA